MSSAVMLGFTLTFTGWQLWSVLTGSASLAALVMAWRQTRHTPPRRGRDPVADRPYCPSASPASHLPSTGPSSLDQ